MHIDRAARAEHHRAWTAALLAHAVADTPSSVEVVTDWIEKWRPLAAAAVEALAGVVAEAPVPLDPGAVTARVTEQVRQEVEAALLPGAP